MGSHSDSGQSDILVTTCERDHLGEELRDGPPRDLTSALLAPTLSSSTVLAKILGNAPDARALVYLSTAIRFKLFLFFDSPCAVCRSATTATKCFTSC